jgi:signal transduction histidine kinase
MKTILLADDEPSLRTLVRTTLEDPRLRVIEAANGLAALECVRRERPDLLLIDWMMPGMSGIDVIRTLRGDPVTARLPVVMLTARGQQQDRELARGLGVRHYLLKPFSPLDLLAKVNEVMAEARGIAHADQDALPELGDAPDAGQLGLYARDLRRAVDLARERSRELAVANARLASLNSLKTDFLSFISHELRTPLNAMSMVDLLDPGADPREQEQAIDTVRSGYERLSAFVQKGLDYFNWLAIERVAPAAEVDLAGLVRAQVTRANASPASGGRVTLQAPAGECVVLGSPEGLDDVLAILLHNALRFSAGHEPVRIELAYSGDTAVVLVSDRGQGFAAHMAREIFEPFTVGDVLHHSAGSGLSLALASAIMGAHGGSVTARSDGPGRGATFTVELPVATADIRA